MKKKHSMISVIALLMALLVVLSGCGGKDTAGKDNEKPAETQGENKQEQETEKEEKPAIVGNDIFDGEHFDEMLWGYYEADCYDYNGSNDDSLEFRKEMKYIKIPTNSGDEELSALPLSIQLGRYTHFMGSFTYEGEYYNAYTELGKSMFRKAYMAEFGDLSEDDFKKIEKILQLNVASVSFTNPEGGTTTGSVAYKLEGSKLSLYDVAVEGYDIIMEDKPFVEYDFLHDGGKLILSYNGLQRNYLAYGYKDTDSGLTFSGYALNQKNRYKNLDGFSFYQFGKDDDVSVYVDCADGRSPIDPVMELDTKTGAFTLSWEQCWLNDKNGLQKIDDPETISGTIIPCTSFGFTDYEGFFLIIDGTCYRYLMTGQEYDERNASGMSNSGNISDDKKDELVATKKTMLEELQEAFEKAGIDAVVDLDSGNVALESSFLFATDSYALSQEGQNYLNTFVDVYTSVVLRDEYSAYVSKIIIEGHTDTSGSYSYNQTLSQNRADAVAQLCVTRNSKMANIIQAEGRSYDYPIYNEDGTVNMEQSRRVTFRFMLSAG